MIPNDDILALRAEVEWSQIRPPEPPSNRELWLTMILAIIDLGRKACDPARAQAQRTVFARQYMEATDPAQRLVELGGDGPPPEIQP